MRKTLLAVIAIGALVLTGGVVASNMGFKVSYDLLTAGANSQSGTNSIGLPYFTKVGLGDNASDLLRDIGLSGSCGANPCNCVANIQRYDTATDQNAPYACGLSDFPLVPGDGYLVKLNTFSPDIAYKIVGSHDPTTTLTLIKGGVPESVSGFHRIAIPYHAIAGMASELMTELGGRNKVPNIQRYDTATDQNVPYAAGGPADFPLVRGNSYLVQVVVDVTFIPSHY